MNIRIWELERGKSVVAFGCFAMCCIKLAWVIIEVAASCTRNGGADFNTKWSSSCFSIVTSTFYFTEPLIITSVACISPVHESLGIVDVLHIVETRIPTVN
jgi:hypothetical protein